MGGQNISNVSKLKNYATKHIALKTKRAKQKYLRGSLFCLKI